MSDTDIILWACLGVPVILFILLAVYALQPTREETVRYTARKILAYGNYKTDEISITGDDFDFKIWVSGELVFHKKHMDGVVEFHDGEWVKTLFAIRNQLEEEHFSPHGGRT